MVNASLQFLNFFPQRGDAERLFKEIVNRRLQFVLNS